MQLRLDRPIVFFDLETTGTQVAHDRIIEIAMLKINPDTTEEELYSLVNPERPIPPEATAIHGITDERVANAPTFKMIAPTIARFVEGCDLGGYNCNRFDVPLLVEEFLRVDLPIDFKSRNIIDVQVIFHKREQRTLGAAYQFYCNRELSDAHTATADTRATYEVLRGQYERYGDLPGSIEGLHDYTNYHRVVDFAARLVYDEQGREVVNFGKHKGRLAEEVLAADPSYYDWIMKSDFSLDTKREFTKIYVRVQARRRGHTV